MSVDAFTVDGTINIDITPFESAIKKVGEELAMLGDSTKQLMEMGGGEWNFNGALNGLKTLQDDILTIKEDIASMTTEFANVQGINTLKAEILSLRQEMDVMKEKIAEMGTVAQETATNVTNTLNNGLKVFISNLSQARYDMELVNNATIKGFEQIQMRNAEEGNLLKQNVNYFTQLEQKNRATAEIGKSIVARLEKEAQLTNVLNQKSRQTTSNIAKMSKEMQGLLSFTKGVGDYFANEETILRNNLRIIQEQDRILADKLAKSERETQLAKEIADLNKLDMDVRRATGSALSEIVSLTGLEADNILKVANSEKDVLAMIEQQVATEEERLMLLKEIDAVESATISKVKKSSGANAVSNKNQLDKMGYLPSRIGSMVITMWGFNEIMDIYEKSMANINAQGQMKTYTELMRTDNRYLTQTKQNVDDIDTGLRNLNKSLYETYDGGMSLQKMYQKVDMTQVGANAMDTAFKYGVQADNLDELTEVMAIYGSEFVRQGRSQEDSILAVNDALDGELRRLKEVGIDKEDLEAKGWDGTTETMITALREIAEERGYDVIAQKITNLSDAITVLEIRIAQDLVGAFKKLEPILVEVAKDFMLMLDTFEWAFSKLNEGWNKFTLFLDKRIGVQKMQKIGSGLMKIVGVAITLGITFGIVYKVVKSLRGALSGLFGIFKKGEEVGEVAKTGGDVLTKSSGGGFKDGFKGATKNVGKIAKAVLEVAVAMVGAFLLIEEAMLLISGIGYTYEHLKPQFETGIEFIKEYGLMIALVGGALLGLSYVASKLPQGTMEKVGKGALNIAEGIALAMGLVAVAVGSLIMPLGAIALLGATANWQQANIDKGIEVIQWMADALNHITPSVGVFLIALGVASLILGYAPELALGIGVGVAVSLGLVAEAIGLLILPLGAIALLGATANKLDQANIQKGADTIRLVGECLKALEPSIRNLLLIDLEVFGIQLVEWGNKFITGKTGLESLVQDILPNLIEFVKNFNELDLSGAESVDSTKVQAITQMATQIPPLFNAMQNLNNAMGTTNLLGNMWGAVGGGLSGKIGMGLKGKLDQLYNDVKDVMDFATKLGGLSNGEGTNTSAITQTANAITQLKAKLTLMVTTISTASTRVKSASNKLGSALKTGFQEGSNGFNTTVVSAIANGVKEIQSRYATFQSGGKALGDKLVSGFKSHSPTLKSTVATELNYALQELDSKKQSFYSKGQALGEALADGFKSKGGLYVGSPAKIARTIAKEMEYSMLAIDNGKAMLYRGGQSLGKALATGYAESNANLRTNVDVLARKGVSNEELQATARKVQANNNNKGQVQQLSHHTINIDMSNSTVIGIQDLDEKIRQSVEKAIVNINSPNGAIGY